MRHTLKQFLFTLITSSLLIPFSSEPAYAAYHFSDYSANPPLRVYATTGKSPAGITPAEIKKIYKLPSSGGKGTIVIIGAYNDVAAEQDLADFSKEFSLPICSSKNGCFKRHLITASSTKAKVTASSSATANWALETALDIEWAHAIAPAAKILLVEAPTPSGANLLKAVDYAAQQKNVAAISMSWGGAEFPEETLFDSHFKSASNAPFFASSGDTGAGVAWPAASPNITAVGGTSLALAKDGSFVKETAWPGSGGGVSTYEKAPAYQKDYSIPKSGGMRAIPDVAYNADPVSGFPIVHNGVWRTVGGTSAGAPQWAAIASLGTGATNTHFYTDKSSAKNASYFRDIISGANGDCGYYCDARTRYDYVTGLGTPQTVMF